MPLTNVTNHVGQIIFEEDNYQNDWEGQDNSGQILEEGVYYYVLDINNKSCSGRITILKN